MIKQQKHNQNFFSNNSQPYIFGLKKSSSYVQFKEKNLHKEDFDKPINRTKLKMEMWKTSCDKKIQERFMR